MRKIEVSSGKMKSQFGILRQRRKAFARIWQRQRTFAVNHDILYSALRIICFNYCEGGKDNASKGYLFSNPRSYDLSYGHRKLGPERNQPGISVLLDLGDITLDTFQKMLTMKWFLNRAPLHFEFVGSFTFR